MPTPTKTPAPPRRRWLRVAAHLALLVGLASVILPAVAIQTAGRLVVETTAYAPGTFAQLRQAAATPLPLPYAPVDSTVNAATAARLYRLTLGLRADDVAGISPRPGDELRLPALDSVPLELFAEARVREAGRPARAGVIAAVGRGLSVPERDYVARVAASPAWRAWDSLATAAHLDILDAAFQLPFAPSVIPQQIPMLQSARFRALLDGTAFRAAHLASVGQREAAVRAIGSTASVGRLLSTEGPMLVDALIGLRMLEASAEMLAALERARPVAGGEERAATLDTALARLRQRGERQSTADTTVTGHTLAREAAATVYDGAASRAEWLEALTILGLAPCNGAWSALTGGGRDRAAAFAHALERRQRHPSDSLLIVHLRDILRHPPREIRSDGVERVLRGFARVGSFITRNPTMESCLIYLDAGI